MIPKTSKLSPRASHHEPQRSNWAGGFAKRFDNELIFITLGIKHLWTICVDFWTSNNSPPVTKHFEILVPSDLKLINKWLVLICFREHHVFRSERPPGPNKFQKWTPNESKIVSKMINNKFPKLPPKQILKIIKISIFPKHKCSATNQLIFGRNFGRNFGWFSAEFRLIFWQKFAENQPNFRPKINQHFPKISRKLVRKSAENGMTNQPNS